MGRRTVAVSLKESFIYIFRCKCNFFCCTCSVDATSEDEALGKFVNYDKFSANCEVRPVVWKGEPHLCLFALRKIFPDDEITFCFRDSTYKLCPKVSKPHFYQSK